MGTGHCDHDFRQARHSGRRLARIFSHFGQQAVVIEDSRKAYEWALKGKKRGQALFCTGSLYFIGELLEITGGKNSD